MTIKQQGGVFGRNPTFNDVTVDNDLVSKTLNVDGGTLFVDAGNNRVGVNETSPDTKLHIKGSGGTETSITLENTGAGGNGPWLLSAGQPGFGNSHFSIYDAANARRVLVADSSGNVTISAGNLIIGTSGNGIDFSATSGTGTSELFDDYEEGTWTPVYTASTTDPTFASYPVRSAHYRKIGAMVFVTARFRTNGYNSDGVGNLRISGLPYAAKSSGSFFDTGGITIHSVQNWGSIPSNGVVKPGDAFISLIGSTGFVDQSVLALGTGTNNNDLSFSGMYVTD